MPGHQDLIVGVLPLQVDQPRQQPGLDPGVHLVRGVDQRQPEGRGLEVDQRRAQRKGEQHEAAYLAINPTAKVPAIIDGDATVFDSNAILLYLAEKTGKFLPTQNLADRGAMLSWMMFIASGIGPFSGQAVHFRNFAPEPKEYALNRYVFEAQRHWGIIENRLAGREWMVGSDYSIVDMALWGWSRFPL
jgi:GST-like protein